MTDLKNFISRWSRRKRAAGAPAGLVPGESRKRSALPLPGPSRIYPTWAILKCRTRASPSSGGERAGVRGAAPIDRPEPLTPPLSVREREPAASADTSSPNPQTAADLAFDPTGLPPIESLTAESDIRPFLTPGVPAELTRAALRRAWAADPKIRDFVGLAENSWDFNAAGAIPGFGPLEMTQELRSQVARLLSGEVSEGNDTSAQAEPRTIENAPISQAADADPDQPSNAVIRSAAMPLPHQGPQSAEPDMAPENNAEPPSPAASDTKKLHGGALPK